LNILSLFDGMSCGQIALERVWNQKLITTFASEIDKHAVQVTKHNYPKYKAHRRCNKGKRC